MEKTTESILAQGGDFLVRETSCEDVFIPESWNEEQKSLAQMCDDFLKVEVFPNLDRIDKMEPGLMVSIVEKAGEQGLLGISVPEEYNGFGMDFTTSLLTTEILGGGHSFAVALAAHTGIGTLPILYFGTAEQKAKYLPDLATGVKKASYCLTEPGSGSDALGAKTKAVLTEDGKHYIINGQKMWITNAGFADVFIVFAKIDGDKFTGFIVERGAEGLTFGDEEHKMGIKGSSTRQVFFSDVKVPVENILGEIGKGHKIAFNILNIGRIKLAAAGVGACKRIVGLSVKYAAERHQFGKPLIAFGAIRYKLAQQTIRTWISESAVYRAGADIERTEHKNLGNGMAFSEALLGAAEEFSVECAMLKVSGSETLDYVSDEGVQIYGGMGYSADAPMDRAYRDSRINRIFEGTNEINRMLTVDMLFKKALGGKLDMMNPAMAVQKELMSVPDFSVPNFTEFLSYQKHVLKNLKKAFLMTAGAAAQKLMQKLSTEQEILMNLANIAILIYEAESGLLRAEKIFKTQGAEAAAIPAEIVKTFIYDACDHIYTEGKNAINSFASGDELTAMIMGIKRFTKHDPFNTRDSRRAIAKAVIDRNDYIYS